jgi:phosphatidylglycerophosphate synthase
MSTFVSATRLQGSILSSAEKRLLVWLARRMPRWVTSDQMSALALLAMLGAGASYWLASSRPIGLVFVAGFLALNWFGDSLDGTLARVRGTERPRFGYYVDHVIDTAGVSFLLGGLALSGYMTPLVALALLAAFLLVLVEVYLATHVLHTFRMHFLIFGPTELRIVLAIGTLVLLVHPRATLFGRTYLLFDVGGAVAAVGLVAAFGVAATRNTIRLYREEPLPPRQATDEARRTALDA